MRLGKGQLGAAGGRCHVPWGRMATVCERYVEAVTV